MKQLILFAQEVEPKPQKKSEEFFNSYNISNNTPMWYNGDMNVNNLLCLKKGQSTLSLMEGSCLVVNKRAPENITFYGTINLKLGSSVKIKHIHAKIGNPTLEYKAPNDMNVLVGHEDFAVQLTIKSGSFFNLSNCKIVGNGKIIIEKNAYLSFYANNNQYVSNLLTHKLHFNNSSYNEFFQLFPYVLNCTDDYLKLPEYAIKYLDLMKEFGKKNLVCKNYFRLKGVTKEGFSDYQSKVPKEISELIASYLSQDDIIMKPLAEIDVIMTDA